MRWLVALLVLLFARPGWAQPAERVDLLLALVTDVSRSIDDTEFALEKNGYEAAFRNRDVIAAIRGGPVGAIAVTYIEFASAQEVRTVQDWIVIRDEASAAAFAARLQEAPRSFWGRTAIGAGMEEAMAAFDRAPYAAERRVIDVCGDGTANNGPEVTDVRDRAIEAGVVINGLAIINEHPRSWTFAHVQPPGGLANWYRDNVTGGPGSFVLEIHDFPSFGTAMTRKLISEIALAGGIRRPL